MIQSQRRQKQQQGSSSTDYGCIHYVIVVLCSFCYFYCCCSLVPQMVECSYQQHLVILPNRHHQNHQQQYHHHRHHLQMKTEHLQLKLQKQGNNEHNEHHQVQSNNDVQPTAANRLFLLQRRDVFGKGLIRLAFTAATALVATTMTVLIIPPESFLTTPVVGYAGTIANAVIRSEPCIQGEGTGCLELANENELIRKLQQQSSMNRERNEKEALDSYYRKNYVDYFTSLDKILIQKRSNGNYVVLSEPEYNELVRTKQIIFVQPKAKGGSTIDWTQKPIPVWQD